jgi:hypothetical protein
MARHVDSLLGHTRRDDRNRAEERSSYCAEVRLSAPVSAEVVVSVGEDAQWCGWGSVSEWSAWACACGDGLWITRPGCGAQEEYGKSEGKKKRNVEDW